MTSGHEVEIEKLELVHNDDGTVNKTIKYGGAFRIKDGKLIVPCDQYFDFQISLKDANFIERK